MNYLSFFLLAILAIGVFSTEMSTSTKVGGGAGQPLESNTQMDSGANLEANSEVHNRFRRWGGYGGYGMGYGGMGGYGRMGYGGMGGYGYGNGYGGYYG